MEVVTGGLLGNSVNSAGESGISRISTGPPGLGALYEVPFFLGKHTKHQVAWAEKEFRKKEKKERRMARPRFPGLGYSLFYYEPTQIRTKLVDSLSPIGRPALSNLRISC